MAMKPLPEVDCQDVTVERVSEHRFPGGTPVPKTLGCLDHVPRAVPFTDMSADVGPGANYPHPTRVAGYGPLTFVDADHTITLSSTGVEVFFIDQGPLNVDGTGTLVVSATQACPLRRPVKHQQSLVLIIDEAWDIIHNARQR